MTIARLFAPGRPVYLVDLPNHGRSPWIDDISYQTAAACLHHTLEQIAAESGAERFHLLGHSMGGKVVMALALLQKQLQERSGGYGLESVVVGDIAPRRYEPGHEKYFRAMQEMPAVAGRKEADDYMAEIVDNVQLRSFLLKNLIRGEDGKFTWKLNVEALFRGYDYILGWDLAAELSVSLPMLFLRGTESDYIVPDRDRGAIWGHFPRARIESVQDSGHWIHTEQPAQVHELVNTFIGG